MLQISEKYWGTKPRKVILKTAVDRPSAQPEWSRMHFWRWSACGGVEVVSLFECVGGSYGSTIKKRRSEAYPISIMEKPECINILWDSMSISK